MKVWTQNVWSHEFFTYCQSLEYLLGMWNNSCSSGGCYFSPQGQLNNKPKHIYLLPTVGFELDIRHAVVAVFFPTRPLHSAVALIKREQFGTTAGCYVTHSSTNPSRHVSGQYWKTRWLTLAANLHKLLFQPWQPGAVSEARISSDCGLHWH